MQDFENDQDRRGPAYYAIIPAAVRYDNTLRPSAKLLYGELTALADATGYCWASNRYFSDLYGLSDKTISALLQELEQHGHIAREVIRDGKNAVVQRRIYVGSLAGCALSDPPLKNRGPSPQKSGNLPSKIGGPPLKNANALNENNTSLAVKSNVPPIVPQRGRARRATKSEPDWKPDRFNAFWKLYPRGESKQTAISAWDRLKPDDETLADMGRALMRQMQSEDWKRGIGIPYAATYLNQRRWEDEKKELPTAAVEEAREKWT